jgi:hypothetical protein
MYPFEATPEELRRHREAYIDAFIGNLQSFFEVMPRGDDFVEFNQFAAAYEVLRSQTSDFGNFGVDSVLSATQRNPLVLVVVRCILGFSPPELASLTNKLFGTIIDQGSARRIDKRARDGQDLFQRTSPVTREQVRALIRAAVELIRSGAPPLDQTVIHRLDKIDTRNGLASLQMISSEGVPYPALLYERYLGRPFATHRDAQSEKVGSILEDAVETELTGSKVPYHKAGVAERFEDMDQAPDFFVPDLLQPAIVIEAKLAEDDGTARDKVTRVQHLAELRDQKARRGESTFEVIACVDGRGFGIRRERVWALLEATRGKLFVLKTIDQVVGTTSLKLFASR